MKDFLEYKLYDSFNRNRTLYTIFRYPLIEDHLYRYNWVITKSQGKVLDVACGSGYGTRILSKGDNVESSKGIDLNSEAFNFSSNASKDDFKLSYEQFNLLENTYTGISYDTIIAFEIVEHFDELNVNKFLQKLKQFSDFNTKIYISTPNTVVFSPVGKWLPYHPIEYTYDSLSELLEKSGYHILNVYGQRKLPEKLHKLISSILLFPTKYLKDKTIENKVVKILYALLSRLELFIGGFESKIQKIDKNGYFKYFIFEVKKN